MNSFPESILVTGGAGFIGSNLALFIKRKHPECDVVCMDNLYRRGSELNPDRLREAKIHFHHGDIRFPDQFPSKTFELILECSAEPSVLAGQNESLDYLFQTNLVGTYNCLEKARDWKAKFLFLSTSRVYPVAPLEGHPWIEEPTRFAWRDTGIPAISSKGVSEEIPMQGARSLYGFTKFASEALIEEYRASFGLQAIVNRCGVIAGPWQMGKVDQGFVALWVFHHLFNKPLRYIGYGGTGKQVRDVLHVDDLARLVEEQIIDFGGWDGWLGNISGGFENSVSLAELTEICSREMKIKLPIEADSNSRPNDLRIYIGNISKLMQRTKWRPQKTVVETVTDVAQWAKKWEAALKPIFS